MAEPLGPREAEPQDAPLRRDAPWPDNGIQAGTEMGRLRSGLLSPFLALAALVSGCAVPVAAALDEPDANRVVVALDQSGIDAAKEADPTAEGKFRVSVARDDVGRALAAMREEELPRPKTRGVLDAADRGQLVPSQAAEHLSLIHI